MVERSASFSTFEALQSIRVGHMVVTPLLVDHSAFDAYMFIIEADNLRILHTGDFRAHGFRGKKLLEKYVRCLRCTMLRRRLDVVLSAMNTKRRFSVLFPGIIRNFRAFMTWITIGWMRLLFGSGMGKGWSVVKAPIAYIKYV